MFLNFISIPTEQTSAVTDLILAIQSLVCVFLVCRNAENQGYAMILWRWVFALLCIASSIGTVVHGFELSQEFKRILWCPLYFTLGLLVALVALAAVAHIGCENISKRLLPVAIGFAFVFALVTQLWSDSFLLFVVYEAIMMTFALTLYVACLWGSNRQRGSGALALGVLLTIAAAAIDTQATMRMNIVWEFDNHGIFHLIQMLGLLIISVGLVQSQEPITNLEIVDAKR